MAHPYIKFRLIQNMNKQQILDEIIKAQSALAKFDFWRVREILQSLRIHLETEQENNK